MTSIRYLASVKALNTRVEVRVNDIPAGTFNPGEANDPAEVPLNEFLLSGLNRFSVIYHANSRPSQVLQPWSPAQPGRFSVGQPASVQIKLLREQDGKVMTPPVHIIDWSGVAVPVPVREDRDFSVAALFPPWAWTRAQPIQGNVAGALRVLQHLHKLLVGGDTAGLLAVMKLKLQEVTVGAYGAPEGMLREGLLQGLGMVGKGPPWMLQPCGQADVDLRVVADGRMVECLRPDGGHALVYLNSATGQSFFLPAMLGVVDGTWQVLR